MAKKTPESVRLRVMHCPRYDNEKWHRRVMVMPVKQIMALDKSFREHGYYDSKPEVTNDIYHQITIWEYLAEKESSNV